jgi:predicted dehydrogenase
VWPRFNGGDAVIRLGIIGCNYGRSVLLPAFRADPRCRVVALAGTDAGRTAALARELGIPQAFGDWRQLVSHEGVDAVAVATPPATQPEIAIRALQLGKPVFVEKPMAANLDAALEMKQAAGATPTMIDFEFPELPAWQAAKTMLDQGAIGALRHVAVTWNTENYATRMRLRSWKTAPEGGGGPLGNFVSHCFHYLEWFCGPITDLSARLFPLPGACDMEATVALAFSFLSGAAGSLTMSAAAYLGSGHRIEFYGEDGTLVLANLTPEYMRGFELRHARRPAAALTPVNVDSLPADPTADGRIAPVARLASRFLDAIEQRHMPTPSFAEGFRVQQLIEAARRSHASGCWTPAGPQEIVS